jgi:hypothetical protein
MLDFFSDFDYTLEARLFSISCCTYSRHMDIVAGSWVSVRPQALVIETARAYRP